MSTAAQGADSAGQGAVQIKFVTRGGTNTFTGSGYEYYRSDKLNANTWFNNRNGVAKPKLKQNQSGVRVGGPIVIPGLFDGHNKAFFFVNYEEFRQPTDTTRNRNDPQPRGAGGQLQLSPAAAINVLALAAANGQLATVDPTIGKLLARHPLGDRRRRARSRPSTSTCSAITFNVPVESMRRYPTVARRLQPHQQAPVHQLAYNYQKFTDFPDTLNNLDAQLPGLPGRRRARPRSAWAGQQRMRSTLGRNLVNEARVGYSGAPVRFFDELNVGHVQRHPRQPAGLPAQLPDRRLRADERRAPTPRRSRATRRAC